MTTRRTIPVVGWRTAVLLSFLTLIPMLTAPAPGWSAEEQLTSGEKLINALLESHPEIDPNQQVFLLWRGSLDDTRKDKDFEIVIVKRADTTMILTDHPKLVKIMGREKEKEWTLEGLTDVGSILTFGAFEGNLERELEDRFELSINAKATVFLGH